MDVPPNEPQPKPPRGGRLVVLGGALALLAGLAIAWVLLASGRGERAPPPPASQAGLVIESGEETGRIDPAKPLRCFVQGQFVGELTLSDCARRNGVATDALDVGIDETGALAAAEQAGTTLTPLPPAETAQTPEVQEGAQPSEAVQPPPAAAPPPVATGACWRRERGRWVRLPNDMDLNACVQQLFAGRCERPGAADYGRWGDQTQRLVTGRVEASADNKTFRTLAAQGANCAIPPLG
jgi:hypothetical protein